MRLLQASWQNMGMGLAIGIFLSAGLMRFIDLMKDTNTTHAFISRK